MRWGKRRIGHSLRVVLSGQRLASPAPDAMYMRDTLPTSIVSSWRAEECVPDPEGGWSNGMIRAQEVAFTKSLVQIARQTETS